MFHKSWLLIRGWDMRERERSFLATVLIKYKKIKSQILIMSNYNTSPFGSDSD